MGEHHGMDGTEGSQLRGVIGINLSAKEREKMRTFEVSRRGGVRPEWGADQTGPRRAAPRAPTPHPCRPRPYARTRLFR